MAEEIQLQDGWVMRREWVPVTGRERATFSTVDPGGGTEPLESGEGGALWAALSSRDEEIRLAHKALSAVNDFDGEFPLPMRCKGLADNYVALGERYEERVEEIRRLRGALASLTERERVAWLEARVAQQDEEIRRKDEQIANLRRVKSEEEARVQRMAERLAKQDEQIAALQDSVDALLPILKRDYRNTCIHESTHRGGTNWEICDDCGMKWADDRGGKPAVTIPPEWDVAESALAKARALGALKEPTHAQD